MRKFAPFILIFLFLLSCKHEASLKNVKDELAVIHQTFEKATTGMSKNDYKDLRKFISKMDMEALFTSLIDSYKKSVKVDLKTSTPLYQIITKETLKRNENYNGNLRFSRVGFNTSRTRACYYFEQSILLTPNRGWDMGTVVFAEKKNGKWVYVKDEYLFIT